VIIWALRFSSDRHSPPGATFSGRRLQEWVPGRNRRQKHHHHQPYVTYEYTDKEFSKHFVKAGSKLREDGIRGVKVDYPATAWRPEGGFDDRHATTNSAYRRAYLDEYADAPTMWTATAFLLDRYHRYWQYHPPFTAGWTYGRRQGHFLAIGQPEDAQRTFQTELKTLDGATVKIPEASSGKWTVISFVAGAEVTNYLSRYATFIETRPFEDVNLIAAVLNDNADAARTALKAKKNPDTFPTLLVPGGMQNPVVQKLGSVAEEKRPNLLLLRPDGSIAVALSALTMSSQNDNVIQNVLEWHDEKAVDEALARVDLDEAQRLAFAFAPLEEPTPAGEKNKPAQKISIPHLRSRAKVYLAMGDLEAALADAEQSYLAVNSQAGYISMRTAELDETESLKATILSARRQGLNNQLIEPASTVALQVGEIECYERLGGMLKYYHRRAA
jgi:hypothetical protein